MKSKIRVYWYRYDKGHGNFGDELNPYLIEKLSGKSVVYTAPYYDTKLNIIKSILYIIVKKRSYRALRSFDGWNTLFDRKIIIAIGSVLSTATDKNIVWGSGIMSKNGKIHPAKFCAVRGKYSQKRLDELGYKIPHAIGDPALLLPLIYKPVKKKKYKLGIIPHYVHYDLLNHLNKDIKVINLLDSIEKITDEINSCEITLSTSLHGIIVSHAYGIPSRWVAFDETSKNELSGDNIKFWDYFSSVNLSDMPVLHLGSFQRHEWIDLSFDEFKRNPSDFLPNAERIEQIQKDLLSVAPFPVKKEFKNQLNKFSK